MENKANYALIGTFVILAVVAVISFVTWLSGRQFDQEYDSYVVEFEGAVRGLTRGSEVRLNGLSVGEVTRLSFDPDDPNLVRVNIQVIDGTPIFVDGSAQLEPLGLTGLNYIQITPGTANSARLDPDVSLRGKMSQLDNLFEGGENIIDGTTMAIRRVNILLSEETISDLQGILSNLNEITAKLREAEIDPEDIQETMKSIERAAKAIGDAAEAIDKSAVAIGSVVDGDVTNFFQSANNTLASISTTADEFGLFAKDGRLMTQDLRDSVNRLSNSGFADLEDTTDALRDLMLTLSNIADQLEQNPAQFFAGEKSEVMELPQ
ncbi:MAG: MCE family protein [Hellea sp.]|nr:MCE family protein [Hellea sp.]